MAYTAEDYKKKREGLKLMYFVLKPIKTDEHGLAARVAIRAYAGAIRGHNEALSDDLTAWMDELDKQKD